ncbi:hypothetical protein Barb4_04334 [Bacteroidales bacterium Barb4]|nr:hypothetical protein Barb4_04334 [Bacteroidales bacterium Barb4]
MYIPKSRAGTKAMMTAVIVRFASMLSWICTPDFEVSFDTNKNVSKPSNTERNTDNFPPSSKLGLILSR